MVSSVLDLLKPRNATPVAPHDVRGVQAVEGGWSIAPSLLADLSLAECRALFGQGYYPTQAGCPDAHAMDKHSGVAPSQRGGTVQIRLRTLI